MLWLKQVSDFTEAFPEMQMTLSRLFWRVTWDMTLTCTAIIMTMDMAAAISAAAMEKDMCAEVTDVVNNRVRKKTADGLTGLPLFLRLIADDN